MVLCGGEPRCPEPIPRRPEHPVRPPCERSPRVRRIGRVRVPVTLGHQPWATLYLRPDGRMLWCLRLWEVDRPVRHVVATAVLRGYARRNGLATLAREVDELVARALRG